MIYPAIENEETSVAKLFLYCRIHNALNMLNEHAKLNSI